MYRSPWFVTHSTRPLMWRFLRGPLRSVLIWDVWIFSDGILVSPWAKHPIVPPNSCNSLISLTVLLFQSRRLHGRFPNVSWVGSRILFENGHPHWLLEASFAACFFGLLLCSLLIAASAAWGSFYDKRNLMLLKKVLCNMVNMVQSWWSSQENVARIVIGIVGSERASWWDHEPFWTLDAYWDATTNWSLSGMMTQTSNHSMVQSLCQLHATAFIACSKCIAIRWIIVRRARPESQGKSVLGDVLLRPQ